MLLGAGQVLLTRKLINFCKNDTKKRYCTDVVCICAHICTHNTDFHVASRWFWGCGSRTRRASWSLQAAAAVSPPWQPEARPSAGDCDGGRGLPREAAARREGLVKKRRVRKGLSPITSPGGPRGGGAAATWWLRGARAEAEVVVLRWRWYFEERSGRKQPAGLESSWSPGRRWV